MQCDVRLLPTIARQLVLGHRNSSIVYHDVDLETIPFNALCQRLDRLKAREIDDAQLGSLVARLSFEFWKVVKNEYKTRLLGLYGSTYL